jgi:hypothetical protein
MPWRVGSASTNFGGNLNVTGTLTAAAKNFKVDHPLDPTNKFLYHDSVESSEMMNIYTGNAILNNDGEVVVSLPDWFEAVNTDFRYQLTAIGAAARTCTSPRKSPTTSSTLRAALRASRSPGR